MYTKKYILDQNYFSKVVGLRGIAMCFFFSVYVPSYWFVLAQIFMMVSFLKKQS